MKSKGNLKEFIDPNLISALAHPLRAHILGTLSEKAASPSDLAREVGVDVNYVAYHVKELEKAGYLELVKTEQRRGAIEHYYRAKAMIFLDDSDWGRLPNSLQREFSVSFFQAIIDEAKQALEDGTFDARSNRHLSWLGLKVDEKGWNDLNAALDECLKQIFAIQGDCQRRLAGRQDAEGIPVSVSLISFEASPGSESPEEGISSEP
jgi:DNA-binding transcriptional ArsR family regulator